MHRTKRQCSRGADLLKLSEYMYCVNKHFTGVQAQVTDCHQCESIQTLDAFYQKLIHSLTVVLIATKLL